MDEYTSEQVLLWYERIEKSVLDFIARVPYNQENKNIQAPILASYWIEACALLDSVFRDMTPEQTNIKNKKGEKKKRNDCKIEDFALLHAKPLDLPNTRSLILISPPSYLSPFKSWKNDLIPGDPYESLDWWHDYNNLKHDFIRSIKKVTLEGTVKALCALHQVLARRRDMVPMLVRRGWFPLGSWVPDYVFDAIKNNCLPGTFVVQTALFAVPVGKEQFPEEVEDIKPVVSGYTCKREFIEFIGSL